MLVKFVGFFLGIWRGFKTDSPLVINWMCIAPTGLLFSTTNIICFEYNLLPWRRQVYKKKLAQIIKISALVSICIVFFGWVIHLRLSQNISFNQKYCKSYLKKIQDLKPQLQAIKRWQAELAQVKEKNCWILRLQTMQQKIPNLLQQIAVLTPKEISVTAIFRNDQKIHISGMTEISQPLLAMVEHLEKLQILHDVHLNQVSVKPQQADRWLSNFTIESTVGGDDGVELCA